MTFDQFLSRAALDSVNGEWPDIPVAPGPAYPSREAAPATPLATCADCTRPRTASTWCECEARATLGEIARDLGAEWLLLTVLRAVGSREAPCADRMRGLR
jgi:hypothetical protein